MVDNKPQISQAVREFTENSAKFIRERPQAEVFPVFESIPKELEAKFSVPTTKTLKKSRVIF
jgi:hypothetical protein